MFSLEGKKAFVTGGTSGIGRAVAERFIRAGAEVAIVGRRQEGEAIAAEIGATFLQADVTREEELVAALQQAEQQLGKLDILINNAGLDNNGLMIEEQTLAELRRCFALNFDAMYALFIHGPRHMNDNGAIVVTSSVAGVFAELPTYSQYSASKAAITSVVRTAALELAPRNIRVNAVCPGSIESEMLPPDHPEIPVVEALSPMARIGTTDDVVGLYHFLVADESRYVTGQKIAVDGGIAAGFSLGVQGAIETSLTST